MTTPLPRRGPKQPPRPMGTRRELLTFLTDELYRYRAAIQGLLPGLMQFGNALKEKPDSDLLARSFDSNKLEKWDVLTQTQFLFVAVRGVLTMAQALRNISGKGSFPKVHASVSSAIDEFEKSAVHAKDMRDLLMHLDAYLLGMGHKELPIPEHRLWVATPEDDLLLYVGGVPLSVRETVAATDALFESVRKTMRILEEEERSTRE